MSRSIDQVLTSCRIPAIPPAKASKTTIPVIWGNVRSL